MKIDFTVVVSLLLFFIFQSIYIIIPMIKKSKIDFSKNVKEKGMSILIPAYNEAVVIENCINASRLVSYKNKEVIVINDGSKDDTMKLLKESLQLEETIRKKAGVLQHEPVKAIYKSKKYDDVFVIDKMNGGKADALNVGIEYASKELVVTLDADSMLKKDSLFYINHYFADGKTVAAGGTVHVVQGFEHYGDKITPKFKGNGLVKHQILHYIHGFYCKKQTQSVLQSMVVIAGAFGTFKREILLKVNGFRKTVGEDMDITMKIYEYVHENEPDKRLIYAPEAVCFTECPEDFANFDSQRIRWQKAFVDCIVEYWHVFYKKLGFIHSSFIVIDGFLLGTITAFTTIFYPIMAGFRIESIYATLGYLAIVSVFDYLQNIVALIIAARQGYKFTFKEYAHMMVFMLWERFTYKLLPLYLNTVGTVRYFLEGDKWKPIERKGEVSIV